VLTERSLSIVIACYRDAGSVRECYRRLTETLAEVTPHYEIIYVNDASPDNAEEILREIAAEDPRVVVVSHARNFGSQNAFVSGMAAARGDGVVLMDGDLQDPPELIPEFVEKWLEGNEIVYGVRVKREEPVLRRFAYKLFYRLWRRLASFEVPLDAGDFGLMDRRVVNLLLREFPERMLFLRGLRAYTGLKHAGVDYVRPARFDGVTTNSFVRNVRWATLGIFSFSHEPLGWISRLAMLSIALTFVGLLAYLGAYVASMFGVLERPPTGFMTLLVVVFFFGTVQLVCLSIMAEYIRHIFEEVKGRPRFVVRETIDHRPPKESGEDDAACPEA
jgi:polyisoprenyl-phosphate glycosyltransferase